MNIAIIGAGNVGKALAGSMTRAGHSVAISARDPEHAQAVADETGARSAKSNQEAVEGADAVVLAVYATDLDDVTNDIGGRSAARS